MGSTKDAKLYLGSEPIDKLFKGSTKVWEKANSLFIDLATHYYRASDYIGSGPLVGGGTVGGELSIIDATFQGDHFLMAGGAGIGLQGPVGSYPQIAALEGSPYDYLPHVSNAGYFTIVVVYQMDVRGNILLAETSNQWNDDAGFTFDVDNNGNFFPAFGWGSRYFGNSWGHEGHPSDSVYLASRRGPSVPGGSVFGYDMPTLFSAYPEWAEWTTQGQHVTNNAYPSTNPLTIVRTYNATTVVKFFGIAFFPTALTEAEVQQAAIELGWTP